MFYCSILNLLHLVLYVTPILSFQKLAIDDHAFWYWSRKNPVKIDQYHGCWCPCPGTRPINDISIEFEIQWHFVMNFCCNWLIMFQTRPLQILIEFWLQSRGHYVDVIMGTIASQITSLGMFTQPFVQRQIKENIKAPRHWPLCGEFTGDRWISRTNGQ